MRSKPFHVTDGCFVEWSGFKSLARNLVNSAALLEATVEFKETEKHARLWRRSRTVFNCNECYYYLILFYNSSGIKMYYTVKSNSKTFKWNQVRFESIELELNLVQYLFTVYLNSPKTLNEWNIFSIQKYIKLWFQGSLCLLSHSFPYRGFN